MSNTTNWSEVSDDILWKEFFNHKHTTSQSPLLSLLLLPPSFSLPLSLSYLSSSLPFFALFLPSPFLLLLPSHLLAYRCVPLGVEDAEGRGMKMESKSSFSRSSEMTYREINRVVTSCLLTRGMMIHHCQPTSSAFLGDTCSMINLMTVGRSLRSADRTQPRATSRIYTWDRLS